MSEKKPEKVFSAELNRRAVDLLIHSGKAQARVARGKWAVAS